MKITEAGKQKVTSIEFAEEMRQLVREWKVAGKPQEEAEKLIMYRIALELTSNNAFVPASQVEKFLDEHATEIDAVVDQMLAGLSSNDVGGGTVH